MSSNSSPQDTSNRGGRVRRFYAANSVVTAAGQAINSSSNVNNNKISSHFQYVSSASPAGSAAIMSSDPTSPQSAIPSSSSANFVRILPPSNVHLIDHGYGTPIAAQPNNNNQQQQHLVTQIKQETQITNYYKVCLLTSFDDFVFSFGCSLRTSFKSNGSLNQLLFRCQTRAYKATYD